MKIIYEGKQYLIGSENAFDLSIKNTFSGDAPTFYNSSQPSCKPLASEDFIGDIQQGGSCNVPIVSINIHCTGTHTECEGHVNDSNITIADVCPIDFIPASLITISPEQANRTEESYHVALTEDMVITKNAIKEKMLTAHSGLIIRTTPNSHSKKSRNYDHEAAPFLTNDAIDYIVAAGVKHLLVDLPSIDKSEDDGQLGNHKRFFKYGKTVSELLFIENDINDGFGFLHIQVPNWALDSAPSRPIFYST